MGIIITLILIAIIYVLTKQNFTVYTSGATQRYATEFSSTNQGPQIYTKLAFNPDSKEEFNMRLNL